MPLIQHSPYRAPIYLPGGHLQTIIPTLFRRPETPPFARERITTPDTDFLDLEWIISGHHRLAIVSHGLEGNTQAMYVKGISNLLRMNGWDVLAWNFRSCSGEMNLKPYFYDSGNTSDLQFVINYALNTGRYQEIALIGFSIGGNITLKLLGESADDLPKEISKAVAISVPVDLEGAANVLEQNRINHIYLNRFLHTLKAKTLAKAKVYPDIIPTIGLAAANTFHAFDDLVTAPLHGYKGVADYYQRASSKQFLPRIEVPTLMISALNDPFLSKSCFPVAESEGNDKLFLETPAEGGHVGFPTPSLQGTYFTEKRALEFLETKF